ncbi:CocE/NonD family hydrolase [Lysobacter capsici]|uniref:CocE/NonD family hydrolase n=1 Tax=Lysobacter capsici TaxID=435897 RepID=UPI0017804672|nr:CocE/NonD family hydrolase [Lysobacter capsici]UOF17314.1 CocE/NonD family hydrolase [Lysobacter capsici]
MKAGVASWMLGGLLAAVSLASMDAYAQDAKPDSKPDAKPEPGPFDFRWDVRIPLRDGVKLSATQYLPRGLKRAGPCVFSLTPYTAQRNHERGKYFASHGYAYYAVDVRGRGNSEGEFTPLLQEARDGHDVVEWLARQPSCNGKVAMSGGSYLGYAQWATVKELPPHLATIVPIASVGPGVDFPILNNIPYTYNMQWLTFVSGHTSQDRIFGDFGFWASQYRRWYEAHAPYTQLDQYIGNPSPTFQTWNAHPYQDAYWDSHRPTPEQYAKLEVPILSVTGHYDDDQPGAMSYYKGHMRYGNERAKAMHYLVIGPWDHTGTSSPQAEVGGLKFGEASLVDINALHVAWYDWTMKQGSRPEFLKDKVAFYVVGEEAWRYAPSLQAVTASTQTWYLDSQGRANDVFESGQLRATQSGGGVDRYVYDPLDTSPLEYEDRPDVLTPTYAYLTDQRGLVMSSGKQLIYHTPALDRDTDIAGFFKLSAYIALDQPDTDFSAKIYEIKADGGSVFLAQELMRARYRKSLHQPELVTPGQVERYDFERFNFTARRLAKGSRLRLVIAPLNSLSMQKNYNSGGVVAEESGKDARKVTVSLYHDAQHPSALYVPIAAKSSVRK